MPLIYFGVPLQGIVFYGLLLAFALRIRFLSHNSAAIIMLNATVIAVASVTMVVHQTLAPLTTIMGLVFFPLFLVCLFEGKIKHTSNRLFHTVFIGIMGYGILQFFSGPNGSEVAYLSNFGNAKREYEIHGSFRVGSIIGDPLSYGYILMMYFIFLSHLESKKFAWVKYVTLASSLLSQTRSSLLVFLSYQLFKRPIVAVIIIVIAVLVAPYFLPDNFLISAEYRWRMLQHVFAELDVFTGLSSSSQSQIGVTPRDLGILFFTTIEFGYLTSVVYFLLLLVTLLYIHQKAQMSMVMILALLAPNAITFSLDNEIVSLFLALTIYQIKAINDDKKNSLH